MSYMGAPTVDTVSTLPGRVAYANDQENGGRYVYVVAVVDGVVFGVDFHTAPNGNLTTSSVSLPESMFREGSWSYDLGDLPGYVGPLAEHFRQSASQEAAKGDSSAPEATPEAITLAREEGRREGRAEAERAFEAWKERANEIAIEYAENNDLCSEFERCMEEIGFRGREREYEVQMDVSATVTVTVSASTPDEAAEIVSQDPMSYVDIYAVRDSAEFDVTDTWLA